MGSSESRTQYVNPANRERIRDQYLRGGYNAETGEYENVAWRREQLRKSGWDPDRHEYVPTKIHRAVDGKR